MARRVVDIGGNLKEALRHADVTDPDDAVLAAMDRLRAAVHEWNAESRGVCNHAGVSECQKEADRLRWFILQGVGGDW